MAEIDPRAVELACLADLSRARQDELPLSTRERRGPSFAPRGKNGTAHIPSGIKQQLAGKWGAGVRDAESESMEGLANEDSRPWAKHFAQNFIQKNPSRVVPATINHSQKSRKSQRLAPPVLPPQSQTSEIQRLRQNWSLSPNNGSVSPPTVPSTPRDAAAHHCPSRNLPAPASMAPSTPKSEPGGGSSPERPKLESQDVIMADAPLVDTSDAAPMTSLMKRSSFATAVEHLSQTVQIILAEINKTGVQVSEQTKKGVEDATIENWLLHRGGHRGPGDEDDHELDSCMRQIVDIKNKLETRRLRLMHFSSMENGPTFRSKVTPEGSQGVPQQRIQYSAQEIEGLRTRRPPALPSPVPPRPRPEPEQKQALITDKKAAPPQEQKPVSRPENQPTSQSTRMPAPAPVAVRNGLSSSRWASEAADPPAQPPTSTIGPPSTKVFKPLGSGEGTVPRAKDSGHATSSLPMKPAFTAQTPQAKATETNPISEGMSQIPSLLFAPPAKHGLGSSRWATKPVKSEGQFTVRTGGDEGAP